MNPSEYERLERIDRQHWFYSGKRAIVRHWLSRYVKLSPGDLLVDAGMGTGIWLEEMAARCRAVGVDDHAESLRLARPRATNATGLLQARVDRLPLAGGCARAVTALDVVEHLEDDRAAIREMLRILRPDGVLALTVPALEWLWSDWDKTLHHYRRYSRKALRRAIEEAGGKILHCRAFNFAALPAIALTRGLRRFLPARPEQQRLEDRLPPEWLNRLLYELLVRPACWRTFDPVWGVSLLVLVQPAASCTEYAARLEKVLSLSHPLAQ